MQTVGGATALMYACQQCRENEVVEIIRKQPHSVRERDRTSKTPLHYCAENVNTSCAEVILRAVPELVDAQDDNGYCPLHLAVIAGNKALIKLLIAKGANVNIYDNERHSAVHWAIVSSEKEALEMIIRAGANPSTPDVRGGYPLHYAVQMCGSICGCDYSRNFEDAVRVVETLLNFGVDVNVMDKDSRQPILWAASAGSADAIIHLVSAGACVEAADKDGLTALHCAASRGHTTTLETLISLCGAHVDVIDGNGCSALFYSVTLGHADATELLLRLGAEPNRQDRKGRTPAHCGAAKGQLETLRILQKHGGNLWLRNVKGDIPLHEAVASGRKDLVLWLLSQNPEAINLANNDGRCPLHIASMYNNTEMVKVLLDAKSLVNPVMRTSKGILMTPLNVALCRGHRSCGKYLQLHGGVPFSKVAKLEPASVFAVRVSPSDEMIKSVEEQKENSSHSNIPRSRSSVDIHGSQELEKSETGEKKKVYRRRRKKKSASNVATQGSESDESVQDVTMKTAASRRVKRSDGKNGQDEKTKIKKVQLETKNLKTDTMSSKSVSGANSNREEEEEKGGKEGEEEEGGGGGKMSEEKTIKTKGLVSSKSFNETKNISDLSPEDFPPQMQTIDRLDAVTMEPEIELQRQEVQDAVSESKPTEETIHAEKIVQSDHALENHKTEIKEEELKKVESSQEKSEETSKSERNKKNELKKSSDDVPTRKTVKSPKTLNSGKNEERNSKASEKSSESNKQKKMVSSKTSKVGAEDLSKKSLSGSVSRNGEGEREEISNREKKSVEESKGNENNKAKSLEEKEDSTNNIIEENTQTNHEETEEAIKSEEVFLEESKNSKNDFCKKEKSEEVKSSLNYTEVLSEDREKDSKNKEVDEEKENGKGNIKKEEKENKDKNGNRGKEDQEKKKEEKEKEKKEESKKREEIERTEDEERYNEEGKGKRIQEEKEKEKEEEKKKDEKEEKVKSEKEKKEKEKNEEIQKKEEKEKKKEEKEKEEKANENKKEEEKKGKKEANKEDNEVVADKERKDEREEEIKNKGKGEEREKSEHLGKKEDKGEEKRHKMEEEEKTPSVQIMMEGGEGEGEVGRGGKRNEEEEEEEVKKKVNLSVESSVGNSNMADQFQNGDESCGNFGEVSATFPLSQISSAILPSGSHNERKVVNDKQIVKTDSENTSSRQGVVNSRARPKEEEIVVGEEKAEDTLKKKEMSFSEGKNKDEEKNIAEEKADEEDEQVVKGDEKEEEEHEREEEDEDENEDEDEEEEEERKFQKRKKETERGGAKAHKVVRLCRRQRDFRADVSDVSVTQLVQNTLRKYHMERGIFYQLLELKRYQIRSGKANEQVLVKRLADEYDRERVFLGMKPYTGLYRFKEFEKFLYDQLKALNARRSFLIPEVKSYDDIDALSAFLKKSRYRILNEVPRPEMACTSITQRCHHSACAYTSVPCSAYITDLRRHRRCKAKREGFFPRIERPPSLNGQTEGMKVRPATLELVQGSEKHVITLPQNSPSKGKRYYVTFTIKGAPACEEERFKEETKNLFKHRHAKSV